VAKETKQDRVVRQIVEQVIEHMHELKNIDSNPNSKEMDVEVWAQSFLKNCLGYTASGGYSIRSQEAKGKMKPDLIVSKGDKPIFVVEVKKITFDLKKSDFRSGKVQLSEYLNQIGNVRWGMLTNGIEWKLFDFSEPEYRGVEVHSFDLKSESENFDMTKKVVEEICYENLFDFHETSYLSSSWEDSAKEALAFSPESLARAILASDVIKYVAKTIRGEHEYKANLEALTDKVYDLLDKGLDNSVADWNEVKQLELKKFIKSQKRAIRKTKRTKKTASAEVPSQVVAEPIANSTPVQTVAMEVKTPVADEKKSA